MSRFVALLVLLSSVFVCPDVVQESAARIDPPQPIEIAPQPHRALSRMSIFQGTILDIRPYATDFGAIVVGDDPHTLVVVRITCMREACGITFEAGSVVEFAISELAGPFEMFLDKDISFILFGKRGHTDQFYGLMPIGC